MTFQKRFGDTPRGVLLLGVVVQARKNGNQPTRALVDHLACTVWADTEVETYYSTLSGRAYRRFLREARLKYKRGY